MKIGISFGVTSGVITTIGMMIGLGVGTGLKSAVIGGILTIAIADALSDALGIHISQESSKRNSERSVWESTVVTFFTKLIIAMTFIIPVLIFDLSLAIKIGIGWGLLLLVIFNYWVAKVRKESPLEMIGEHLLIAILVIVATFFIGKLIGIYF